MNDFIKFLKKEIEKEPWFTELLLASISGYISKDYPEVSELLQEYAYKQFRHHGEKKGFYENIN